MALYVKKCHRNLISTHIISASPNVNLLFSSGLLTFRLDSRMEFLKIDLSNSVSNVSAPTVRMAGHEFLRFNCMEGETLLLREAAKCKCQIKKTITAISVISVKINLLLRLWYEDKTQMRSLHTSFAVNIK